MANIINAGKLFYISSGEYSDYNINGVFLALEDITTDLLQSVVDEIKAEINSPQGVSGKYGGPVNADSGDYEKNEVINNQFLPRLIRRGVLIDIDCEELHRGSYGRVEIDGVTTYGP